MVGIEYFNIPKSCDECPLIYHNDWGRNCIFEVKYNKDDYNNSRHPDCPLVEIKEEE